MKVYRGIVKYMDLLLDEMEAELLPCNWAYLSRELERCYLKENKAESAQAHLYYLSIFLRRFAKRDLRQLSQLEIAEWFRELDMQGRAETTKQMVRKSVKMFYRYLLGEGFSAFIRVREVYNEMPSEALLTELDVMKLISWCECLRDKAMLSVLYDGGLRPFELVNLKVGDVLLEDYPVHLRIAGKSGRRRIIPLTSFSTEYLFHYLSSAKRFGDGYLFVSRRGGGKLARRSCIRMLLARLNAKAGLGKRVYPALFRHSRASHLAKQLNEIQLCNFMGWVPFSRIARNYVHSSVRDLDEAMLKGLAVARN